MKLKSMRVRLPLTYAAIALLTALALSGVLFLTLRNYYTQRERLYLTDRAKAIQPLLSKLVESGAPPEALKAQVSSLAFFTQARVRLLDKEQHVLANSGDPNQGDIFSVLPLTASVDVKGGAIGVLESQSSIAAPDHGARPEANVYQRETLPGDAEAFAPPISGTVSTNGANILYLFRSTTMEKGPGETAPSTETLVMLSAVPRTVAFGSYDLIADGQDSSQRSNQIIGMPIKDTSGKLAGTLELSEGPAFGRAILESVARASLAAALVAVLLAAIAGWLVSGQVTSPLTALAEVTQDMASGDLSGRADPGAAGEFGELGSSFNRMAERVEATVAALRKFASDAAHELKTPLTALATDLEMATEADLTSQERDDLVQRARGQVQRLERLMDNLLDLSRLETGSQEGAPHAVDLTELLQEAGENFASQAEQHELDFDLQLPSEPLVVMGYPEQLRRAVANLLDNAVKFTLPGGRVQLHLSAVEGEAKMCVSDSGIGLQPEDLEQVFQRFHRGRNASAYNGSGLGLAIVQAIVQAHGGQVWAGNNPGGGARFTIRLPKGA